MEVEKINPKKIKVLQLINSFAVGGAEILLINYFMALGSERYQHYVYSFGSDGPIRTRIENLGITVHFGPKIESIKNPVKFLKSLKKLLTNLIAFIKYNRIQIIQSHLLKPNQIAVIIGKIVRLPAFPTVHNTMAFVDLRNKKDLRVHLLRIVNKIIYKFADKIIAVSDDVKKIIQNEFRVNSDKIVVIKNGIVLDYYKKNISKLKCDSKKEMHLFKVIGVGSLTHQKGFEILIMAMGEIVKKGYKNIIVSIAGEGVKRKFLEKIIEENQLNDFVKLLGNRDDIMNLLMKSNIFVMPSRYEGLSIAMIEAMACGIPIISSDAPGLKNHINHYENGLIFPNENYKTLAVYILKLYKDEALRNKLSIESKISFEKNYDLNKNIKTMETLINDNFKRL